VSPLTEGSAILHINRPRGHYLGQVRRVGCRLWDTVTGPRRSAHHALADAVLKGKGMKRARVLFIDNSGWYDPHIVMEARLA
jgi:hypothetical protein